MGREWELSFREISLLLLLYKISMEAVLVAMSVPATTEDDGFSLITDKLSYNLTPTSDVEIVTSDNRRIPAHSGVLVSCYLFWFTVYIFLVWFLAKICG
jgi:hypothetical protein